MILEMVPDMPEMLAEAALWKPKSYPDHFRDSGFKDGALAIEAYDRAPAVYRRAFDRHVAALNDVLLATVAALFGCQRDSAGMRHLLDGQMAVAHGLLAKLSGIIHGASTTLDQGEVDRTFDTAGKAPEGDGDGSDQFAIDALFD